jgi:hypothetical protein
VSAPSTTIEPIVGWRVWHVDPSPGGVRLLSWSERAEWPLSRRMVAACRRLHGLLPLSTAHEAPRLGHACGIYAFRDREDAERLLEQLGPVGKPAGRLAAAIGRVSLWGRVIENTGGWRSQYAYPYDLILCGGGARLAEELRAGYRVEVSVRD